MAVDKELWIDLCALISCSHYVDNLLVISYEYNTKNPEPLYDHITYCLRKAIRAVGFKIIKVETILKGNLKCVLKSYYTDIPSELYDNAYWNDWVDGIYDQKYI